MQTNATQKAIATSTLEGQRTLAQDARLWAERSKVYVVGLTHAAELQKAAAGGTGWSMDSRQKFILGSIKLGRLLADFMAGRVRTSV